MKSLTNILFPLKGYRSFDKVFEYGFRIKSFNAFGVFIPANDNNNSVFFGISVPKRNAKKAVVRNRIKRLLRESLKKTDEEIIKRFDSFVIVWTNCPKHPKLIGLAEVEKEVKKLIDLAIKKIDNKLK